MKDTGNLNKEYRKVYQTMCEYLYTKNINKLIRKDILADILAIAEEGQLRGASPHETFGDYESFCDEVSKNAIAETKLETISLYLGAFLMLFSLSFLKELLFSLQTTLQLGYLLYDRADFCMYFTDFLMITLVMYMYQRYAFHLPKMRILIIIIGFIVIDGGMYLIAPYLLPAKMHIPLLFIGCICFICVIMLSLSYWLRHKHYQQFLNYKSTSGGENDILQK